MRLTVDEVAPLHVSSAVIRDHVDFDIALTAARTAAAQHIARDTKLGRVVVPLPGGWMRIMACSIPELGVFGYKEFHLAADKLVRYVVYLFDVSDGRPLGAVDAAMITTLRTAATAAVALEHVVGSGRAVRLGVVGTGAEAYAGVEALSHVFAIEDVTATSRRVENRTRFVDRVTKELGLPARPVESPRELASRCDVLYIATDSRGAVVVGPDDIDGIPVVASIGSTLPIQRELDSTILVEANRIVVDTCDIVHESGDMISAVEQGFDPARLELLGTVLASPAVRASDDLPPVLFSSIGSPEQDLVLAYEILEFARSKGLATPLPTVSSMKTNL